MRIELPENQRRALASRMSRDLAVLQRAGRLTDLHQSYLDSVAWSLTYEIPDTYNLGELELGAAKLLVTDSILRSPRPGSPQAIAEEKKARAENPTRADYAAMPADKRLEVVNEVTAREREKQAAKDAKLESPEHSTEQLKSMSPGARLSLVNELKRFGADISEPKTYSPEELKRFDAARRLDIVNAQAEASRRASRTLGKRLAQVRKESA